MAADKAQVAQLELKLKQSTLYAPLDTTVRSRLLQPGDMASAQVPVLALAINSPKWVRAYVNEVNLGKIKPGQQAYVTIDAYPNEKFPVMSDLFLPLRSLRLKLFRRLT